uniref:Uncharacterized protein n=1 Tax=Rangifer tarandus platyrhynchus TaxID=3082113 RepID=A0ACB0EP03_RANTA|nr:unnamed protein product [Rangifer tarandus platyrhynchus]
MCGRPAPRGCCCQAAARPPAAASGRRAQLCARVCVCLSECLPLHHSGTREGSGPRRPAAEWLPVHTLSALSPPTAPLLRLAFSLLPCSSFSCRSRAPLGREEAAAQRAEEKGGEGSAGVFCRELGASPGAARCRQRAGPYAEKGEERIHPEAPVLS